MLQYLSQKAGYNSSVPLIDANEIVLGLLRDTFLFAMSSHQLQEHHKKLSFVARLIDIPEPTKVVGCGGFSDLFIGIFIPTGLILALKRPRFETPAAEVVTATKQRLERESILWSILSHPNVLPCYGTFDISNETYLVSPWMDNGDLSKFLSACHHYFALPLNKQLIHPSRIVYEQFDEREMICGVASAVAYLHSLGIIHGDLKAGNILLDTSRGLKPVLCDFGLTKKETQATWAALKGAGSLRWASPERLEGRPKTTSSDVYAFGITVAEILTGKLPFPDIALENVAGIIMRVFAGGRPLFTPSGRRGMSFDTLWNLASSCWDRDPDRRLSARDIYTTLSSLPA